MDNNLEEVINQLRQQLAGLTDGLTGMTEAITKSGEVIEKTVEQEEKELKKSIEQAAGYTRVNGKLVKQEEQRIELEAKLNKELDAQFGATRTRFDKQKAAFNEQLKQLNYIADSSGKLSKTTIELNSYQQKLIQTAKKLSEEESRRAKSQANIMPELKKGLSDVGRASWGFAAGLAKGETGFNSLIPLMDTVAAATQGVGKALLGSIPVIGGFAAALFGALTEAGLAVSKLAIQLLEKTLKDFQDMSNAGALVEGGMTALYEQLIQAGMTTEGFKKVVKESGSALAAWQGTVGKGAQEFAKAVGDLSLGQAGDDLRKLGLTADAMGESAAAFLEQEIRLGRGRSMDAKKLTEGTVQYVKELDLLQKATGLSRQDLQKQRDEMLSDGRYRASMQGVNEKNEKALTAWISQFIIPRRRHPCC
jgi:hypothetical protein